MSTGTTLVIESTSSNATEKLGEQLGQHLCGGEVIELVSDLGGGKTTFVRGLGRGVGSADNVASPTFTITKTYHGSKLTLQHFDFYRLNEPGVVAAELVEYMGEPETVTAIEWSDIVKDVLPEKRLTIVFEPISGSEESRHITFSCPSSLSYLLKGLK